MNTLFDPGPERQKKEPVYRCKHCIHLYEHQYNSTKYCSKQKGRNTAYGHKKIKASDPACLKFEILPK